MEVTYKHCAGLDVHKKTVVACALTPGADGKWVRETRTFGTMTDVVVALGDWLRVGRDARGDGEHGRVLEADFQPAGRRG